MFEAPYKKHKDELEIQQGELHNHILKTKKEFKLIIKNFIQCYEAAAQREQDLLDKAIKDKENEKSRLQSYIREHDDLRQKLSRAKTDFNSKKDDIKKQIEKTKKHSKEKFYENSDIDSIKINELQNVLDSLENTRRTCLDFIVNKLDRQNKDMEKR